MRLTARVPATSANLGPGFDSFGLALNLYNEVTVDTDAEPGVTWEGQGAGELPTDGTDLITRAMAFTAERQLRHHPGAALPPFALHGVNRIPLERGLGSSSAAAVAGVALASVLLGDAGSSTEDGPYSIYATAATLEGHPDNAAPAAYGGLTIVADAGVFRLDPHPDLRPVLLIPDLIRLPTEEARRALPAAVPRSDAVFNLAHASLLVVALTREPELLGVALRDRLHEDVRMALVPEVGDLLGRVRAAGIPACVSGAGPTLLAFEQGARALPDPGEGWTVLRPGIRSQGVAVAVAEG